MQHITLMVAAFLTFAIGFVHSWLGEVKLIGPLLSVEHRSGILTHKLARQVLRFSWHITTVAWWGAGAILLVLADAPPSDLSRLILLVMTSSAALTGGIILAAGRGRHHAWIVFWLIAALCAAPLFGFGSVSV